MKIRKPSIVKKFWASFETGPGGYSARKLSAFFAVNVAAFITSKLPSADLIYGVCAWLIFALLCLSVITAENIIMFKNGGGQTQPPQQDEESAAHV